LAKPRPMHMDALEILAHPVSDRAIGRDLDWLG
jgi:hypothetical protein